MRQSGYVFRVQLSEFMQEKGMIVFYIVCVAVAGIIVPFFLHGVETSLTIAALFTVMFLKPIISDSMAGERERKTLESLLSTPISGQSIMWGKTAFGLLFAVCFFSMNILCVALTNWATGYKLNLAIWQWISIMALAVLTFGTISIAGVYSSALSGDLRTANSKITLIAYPLGLLFIVFLSVTLLSGALVTAVVGAAIAVIFVLFILRYTIRIKRMNQSRYFENIKIKAKKNSRKSQDTSVTPKTQFGIVFRHEFKSLLTLKILMFSFLFLCFAPAIIACMSPVEEQLNVAVLITAFMMPRIPSNLIAHSIGGEKVYKTGESLLSTPLQVRSLFLAKCTIPILISVIMLTLSSVVTLASTNIPGAYTSSAEMIYSYSVPQLVLLFPVSIMSSITMVFISGVLSAFMKTPRQGLYATSVIGVLFVAPVAAITYLTKNTLMWSLIYFVILLICNVICAKSISDKISRPMLMDKL